MFDSMLDQANYFTFASSSLVLELDPLLPLHIDIPTLITSPFLLIFLFRETLPLRYHQIFMSFLRIVIGYICIAR